MTGYSIYEVLTIVILDLVKNAEQQPRNANKKSPQTNVRARYFIDFLYAIIKFHKKYFSSTFLI